MCNNNRSDVHDAEHCEECEREQCAIAIWRAGPEAAQGVGRGARVRAELRPTQALRRRHQLPRARLAFPLPSRPLCRSPVPQCPHCPSAPLARVLVVHC